MAVERYRAILVWSLRGIAIIAAVLAVLHSMRLVSDQPLGNDPSVVLYAIMAEFHVVLLSLASAEMLAVLGADRRMRLIGNGLAWTMRGAAVGLLLLSSPALVATVISNVQYPHFEQLMIGFSSLFTVPLLLLGFAEALAHAIAQSRQIGTPS